MIDERGASTWLMRFVATSVWSDHCRRSGRTWTWTTRTGSFNGHFTSQTRFVTFPSLSFFSSFLSISNTCVFPPARQTLRTHTDAPGLCCEKHITFLGKIQIHSPVSSQWSYSSNMTSCRKIRYGGYGLSMDQ